jgi:4-amino-4-deoxy-L-arabinose transferase-like glycosyltransferase
VLVDESRTVLLEAPARPVVRVDPPPSARPSRRSVGVWVGLLVLAGIGFRLWLAFGRLGVPDSDEAVVGLMAVRLLRHGELPAFFWGQPYGGSLEAVLVAPSIRVFGATTFALKLPSLLLGLGASWLTWRIARRRFSTVVAVSAGLVSLFSPPALVWFGTKERGFYPLTAVLGLVAVLAAICIDEEPGRLRYWFGLGAAVGVGWWMSPNIAYYAVPIAIWLVVRGHWRQRRGVAAAATALVLGSSVWIVANIQSGFASLRVPPWADSSTYWSRLVFFGTGAVPFSLGLRRPFGGKWTVSPLVGGGVYLALLAGLAVAIFFALRNTSWTRAPELFLLATAPFLYAIFPANWVFRNGRYIYFVASLVPLLLCHVMTTKAGRIAVAGVVVAGLVAFVSDTARLQGHVHPSAAPIGRALQDEGFHTAVANYWIAYQMTYATDEEVMASPSRGRRYGPYVDAVKRLPTAYVFPIAGPADHGTQIIAELRRRHIAYRRITRVPYYALLPESPRPDARSQTIVPGSG